MEENNSFIQKSMFSTSENQSKEDISSSTVTEEESKPHEMVCDEMAMFVEEEKLENLLCSRNVSALANEENMCEMRNPSAPNINCNQNRSVIECRDSLKNSVFNDFYIDGFQKKLFGVNSSNDLDWRSGIKENSVPFKNGIQKSNSRNLSKENEGIVSFHDNVAAIHRPLHGDNSSSTNSKQNAQALNYAEGALTEDINVFQLCSDNCKLGNKIGEQIILISPNKRSLPDTYHVKESNDCSIAKQQDDSVRNHRGSCQHLGANRSPKSFVDSSCYVRTGKRPAECIIAKPVANACGHTDTDKFNFDEKFAKKPLPLTKSKRHFKKSNSALKFSKQSKDALFTLFIAEILRSTHPNLRLNISVCRNIEMFLRDMVYRIGDEAENLMSLGDRKFFTPRVLKFAIKFCLEHIKNEADVVAGRKTSWMA